MITKPIDASTLKDYQLITIGRQMESGHRQFIFDCSGFEETVSSITLVHEREKDLAPYIVETSGTDMLAWTISDTDTAYDGYGRGELRITFAGGLAKSVIFRTQVIKSITGDTVIPEPLQSWYDAMIDYINDHSITEDQLEQAVADYIEQHPIEAPVTSVNGKQGDVVLAAADVGAVATETDPVFAASPAHGITASDITSWNNKSDFSGSYTDLENKPTIPTAVSQLENDAGYITSAPVTSVNNETGAVVISASDLGAYVKPSGGIPKNDLASDVQTSLSKADSALQTAPVTSVNTKTGAVTLTANDVGALPSTYTAPVQSVNRQTGVVVLDAEDVGALPDDTAYVSTFNGQSGAITYTAPVTSVNGETGAVTGLQPALTAGTGITITNNVISSTATGSVQTVNSQQPDGNGNVVTQRELTQAQYDALTPAEKNNGVLYMITDSAPSTDYYTKTETDGLLADKIDEPSVAGTNGQVLTSDGAGGATWETPSGGGGSIDWQLLYDGTTTEEANLHIAVTNISVSEFIVYVITYPASNVTVYISPNQYDGSHNSRGYGRAMMGTGTTTGAAKFAWCRVYHMIGNLASFDISANFEYSGAGANVKHSLGTDSQSMTIDQKYTSISIGTFQAVSANTRVIVLGR